MSKVKTIVTVSLITATALNLQGRPIQASDNLPIPNPRPPSLTELKTALSLEFKVSVPTIDAVILRESSGRPHVIAHNPRQDSLYGQARSNAYGLMQVRGIHAGTKACPEARSPTDLLNPAINLRCGTRLLAGFISLFGLEQGLAAYHGGAGCIRKGLVICPAATKYSEQVLFLLAQKLG
jgi:soluble lytic murein transglycosylase-like protein